MDGSASITEALRKAKVACFKLGLKDFGDWVEHELSGYDNSENDSLPTYRKLRGIPQAQNPVRGWQAIGFQSQEIFDAVSTCPVGTSIPELEASLTGSSSTDGSCFSFHYAIEQQNWMWDSMGHRWPLRLRVDIQRMRSIIDAVRNILTDWTLRLEEQGVLGENLIFSTADKAKSASATDQLETHIHINQVGAFVQNASHSVVQGGVDSKLDLGGVGDLIGQIEAQRDQLPAETWDVIKPQLEIIRSELEAGRNPGVVSAGLKVISEVCTKAGASLAAAGIIHMIHVLLPSLA
jgi:hypothetical protein